MHPTSQAGFKCQTFIGRLYDIIHLEAYLTAGRSNLSFEGRPGNRSCYYDSLDSQPHGKADASDSCALPFAGVCLALGGSGGVSCLPAEGFSSIESSCSLLVRMERPSWTLCVHSFLRLPCEGSTQTAQTLEQWPLWPSLLFSRKVLDMSR